MRLYVQEHVEKISNENKVEMKEWARLLVHNEIENATKETVIKFEKKLTEV